MVGRSTRIGFQCLTDLAEGRLDAREAESVEPAAAGCERDTADLAWLRRTIALMRMDDLEDAPPELIARAHRLFAPTARPAPPGPIERFVAALRLDALDTAPALGVRSAHAPLRQLLYGAGAYDLDIRVSAVGDGWKVAGQVLGPELRGEVTLRGDAGNTCAELSELGEFVLPPVPAGGYRLVLRGDGVEIEVLDLPVGE